MTPEAVVFVHSYDSRLANWHSVVFGTRARPGRLRKALEIAGETRAELLADDSFDPVNNRLYRRLAIRNLGRARRTTDEVRNAIAAVPRTMRKIFVTSPDHLPRVARDALALGAENAMFVAAETPYTARGVAGVAVHETPDEFGQTRPFKE